MTSPQTDAARLNLALTELRLPAIKALWPRFAEQADKEGWPASRLLSTLVEHELAERDRRRIERHLAQAKLLPGKTLETFCQRRVKIPQKCRSKIPHFYGSGDQPVSVIICSVF